MVPPKGRSTGFAFKTPGAQDRNSGLGHRAAADKMVDVGHRLEDFFDKQDLFLGPGIAEAGHH